MSLEERAEIAQDQEIQDSKEEFARSCRPDSQIFDENKVNFCLVSGSEQSETKYQSDAIFAQACLKTNQDPIPLNCTWYNIPSDESEKGKVGLQVIDNCTGACFQPSIEDIGKKVCVHAIPHDIDIEEDDEELGNGQYMGMPLFAEVGPLVLDPKMEEEVEQTFQDITGSLDFSAAFKSPRGEQSAGSEEQPSREKIFKIMSINEVEVNGDKQSDQFQQLKSKNAATGS